MAAAKVKVSIWTQVSAELRCCHRSDFGKRDSPRPWLSAPAASCPHRERGSKVPLLRQAGGGPKEAFSRASSVRGAAFGGSQE